MAKSIRSKTKRNFRSKKREDGVYAATEAARLHRLNAKLVAVSTTDKEGDIRIQDAEGDEDQPVESMDFITNGGIGWVVSEDRRIGSERENGAMEVSENPTTTDSGLSKPISTHGPRCSRREEWRKSKGLDPKPRLGSVNRQGTLAARRKAGRSKRRR